MKAVVQSAENIFIKGLNDASNENIDQFVGDTIYRFENNDPTGSYTKDVIELKTNFVTFQQGVTAQEKGDQKVSTSNVQTVLDSLYSIADSLEDKIKSVFGRHSTKLIEFFPRGKGFIRKARRGEIGNAIAILQDKAKFYEKDLGGDFVTNLATIHDNWELGLKSQSGEKTEVNKGRNSVNDAILPMATVLNRLFLKVRLNNEGKEKAAVAIYFDESPLISKISADHDGLGRTYGVVTDIVTGAPLADVAIRVIDGKNKLLWSGKTDVNGKWRTANISIGLFSFTFEKTGFTTQTLAHEILDYQDTVLDVKLAK